LCFTKWPLGLSAKQKLIAKAEQPALNQVRSAALSLRV
jgi:hypothetical protein